MRRTSRTIEQEKLVFRVIIVVVITAFSISTYFSYLFFVIEGESELCMQKYDLPPWHFYDNDLECFISVAELATKVGHIFGLMALPLILSLLLVLWLFRHNKIPKLIAEQASSGSNSTDELARKGDDSLCRWRGSAFLLDEVKLLFWTIALSLVVLAAAVLALEAAGIVMGSSISKFIGSVGFYALHLFPASFAVLGLVHLTCCLKRVLEPGR